MSLKRFSIKFLFLILFIGASICSKAQSVGDLAVISASTVNPDAFRVIALNTIPANSIFTFTDNAWDGTALQTNEGYLTWNTGLAAISPGTIITFSMGGSSATNWSSSSTVSKGSIITASSNYTFSLNTTNENLFILSGYFTSSPSLSSFIWGYNTVSWITSGTVNSSTSYLPSSLNSYNTAFPSPGIYDAYFANGNTSVGSISISNTDKCSMIALLKNYNKWVDTVGTSAASYNISQEVHFVNQVQQVFH